MADYICKICGAQILGVKRYRATCGDACRKIYNKREKQKYINIKRGRSDMTYENTNTKLRRIAAECARIGITYGEYMVRKEGRI